MFYPVTSRPTPVELLSWRAAIAAVALAALLHGLGRARRFRRPHVLGDLAPLSRQRCRLAGARTGKVPQHRVSAAKILRDRPGVAAAPATRRPRTAPPSSRRSLPTRRTSDGGCRRWSALTPTCSCRSTPRSSRSCCPAGISTADLPQTAPSSSYG